MIKHFQQKAYYANIQQSRNSNNQINNPSTSHQDSLTRINTLNSRNNRNQQSRNNDIQQSRNNDIPSGNNGINIQQNLPLRNIRARDSQYSSNTNLNGLQEHNQGIIMQETRPFSISPNLIQENQM